MQIHGPGIPVENAARSAGKGTEKNGWGVNGRKKGGGALVLDHGTRKGIVVGVLRSNCFARMKGGAWWVGSRKLRSGGGKKKMPRGGGNGDSRQEISLNPQKKRAGLNKRESLVFRNSFKGNLIYYDIVEERIIQHIIVVS